MSMWRENKQEANYLEELYAEEEELVCFVDVKEEVLEDSEDEVYIEDDLRSASSPVARNYSCLSSSKSSNSAGRGDRERSRSPIVKVEPESDPQSSFSPDVVIQIFNKEEWPNDDKELPDDDVVQQDLFLDPDAHALYVNTNGSGDMHDMQDRNEGESNIRARVRGGRRGCVSQTGRRSRARRGGSGGGRRLRVGGQQSQWAVDHLLEEIWITDDDVPSELKDLARDVVRKREARAQEMRDKAVRIKREREFEGQESESESEDEFQNATDGRGNPLLEGKGLLFEWSPMETFQPEEEVFTPERTGSVKCHQTPYDAFRSFWDDSLLEHIVKETNRYADQITSSSFQKDWYPTNAHEVMCLFAFWMMLGIVRMPTIRSCFSRDPLLATEIFSRIFTLKRYIDLTRALHFVCDDPATVAANSTNSDIAASCDRLYSLRPIITQLNANFQANYIPSKDICIDDSLILWKGKLDIKQYNQSKAAKIGIKTYELCESGTGYLWSFIVYTGKQANPLFLKSSSIVKKLVNPLLNKGYRLFMDSWYNSPRLARFLKRNGTDCVGTLPPCHQDVPALINLAPLNRGQLVARHSGDVCVLSWQDKRRITMISTCHGTAAGLARVPSNPGTRPLQFKPQVVLDYNKSMGGVDLKDQMLEPYLIERKRCNQWDMKLFKRLLNVTILNASILLESSLQCRQDHLNFRLRLVDSILTHHLGHRAKRNRLSTVSRYSNPTRLIPHIHWPAVIEPSGYYAATNRKTQVRCTVCLQEGRKTSKTPYKCEACNVPLCALNCFKKYHTT